MTHNQKLVVTAAVLLASASFFVGRYSVSFQSKEETSTVTDTKTVKDTKTDMDKDKHKETTTTVTEKPDGTKETVIKTTEDTKTITKKDSNSTNDTKIDAKTSKEVTKNGAKTTVSVLAGSDFRLPVGPGLYYGASVLHAILGPVVVGAWGLSNGTGGVSLGLTF